MLESERDVLVLDTRNDYETRIGKFKGAVDPNLKRFSEFGRYLEDSPLPQDKTILIYCTGGIRCEKAAILMREMGVADVLQLEGGILKYFEQVGGAHYRGDCFVFDGRRTLAPDLSATGSAASARALEDPDMARKS